METGKPPIKKTWRPKVAGILDIVCLILGGPGGIFSFWASFFAISTIGGVSRDHPAPVLIGEFLLIFVVLIMSLAIIGLAFAGGIFAIQRRSWKLALSGAVSAFAGVSACSIFLIIAFWDSGMPIPMVMFVVLPPLIGTAAIVLTVLSKNEFE